jgi:hypothetical protein
MSRKYEVQLEKSSPGPEPRESPHLQLFYASFNPHPPPDSIHFFPAPLIPSNLTMSKSVKDSTRFTATGVWAHTKPGRSLPLDAGPAPKNETPQQKVKRLREAANRAKMAQVTRWDVAYFYGRAATDFIHRATVYGIIFATGTTILLPLQRKTRRSNGLCACN